MIRARSWIRAGSRAAITNSIRQPRLVRLSQRKEQVSTAAAAAWAPSSHNAESEDEEAARRKAQLLKEIDEKKGRGFSDPLDVEDMMSSTINYEDLPDWSPKFVSRAAQEMVQIHPDKIPTLSALASLELQSAPPPHPAVSAPEYAKARMREQAAKVSRLVEAAASPQIAHIKTLESWEDKQDAVDALFEDLEADLMQKEVVLGKHPKFGSWVETALEACLRKVQAQDKETEAIVSSTEASASETETEKPQPDLASDTNSATEEKSSTDSPVETAPTTGLPVFMDCYSEKTDSAEVVQPRILHPLEPLKTGQNLGRLLEEWELAAHTTTRRIMLRDCTRQIAQALTSSDEGAARVLVDGPAGSGKTAAIAATVASARTSGWIVLYLPDGDQYSKNGFYLEPSTHRKGVYDLPILSQHVCQHLLDSHSEELSNLTVDSKTLEHFLSADQRKKLEDPESMPVVDLLTRGVEKASLAAASYGAVVETLMQQEETPVLLVADEFNSYFQQPGHYFHMDYDVDVKKSIPYEQISLFQPFLEAMALNGEEPRQFMKRGGVVVGLSRSRAVSTAITDGLVQSADSNTTVVTVPRLSSLETEHMLANYESIGLGKLRLDQGDVVLNPGEMAFLRTVSSGIPQKLMDACIL